MAPKIKNIVIFVIIGSVFASIYFFYIKKDSDDEVAMVSSSTSAEAESAPVGAENSLLAQEFLTLLLSVRSINLDDSIFSDDVFYSLRDSSIVLIPDGNEGRPNPFAPLGSDIFTPLPSLESDDEDHDDDYDDGEEIF